MVILEGMRPVFWGFVIGLVMSSVGRVLLTRGRVEHWLDWPAIAVAAVAFVLAGLAASCLPAYRASVLDPNAALREL